MSGKANIANASDYLDGLGDAQLSSTDHWVLIWRYFLLWKDARKLLNRAKLDRGIISPRDLSPEERRELVDPANLDLHALAAGPIMHVSEIYLPAGRLSMDEARRRERAVRGAAA